MIFFITNTSLVNQNSLLMKVREAAMAGVDYILLRENHLTESEYYDLALSVLQMLTGTRTELVICHRPEVARRLKLKQHARFHERGMESFSVATHTREELMALDDKQYGFYGNVFESSCKPGVPPKAIEVLKCHKNAIALGGVNKDTLHLLKGYTEHIGIMSGWLTTQEVAGYVRFLKRSGY